MYIKEKEIYSAYILKFNSNCEKHIIVLTIPNEEKEGWHYLAVTKLLPLFRGIMSKYHVVFCCLNCVHNFATKNKLESPEKVCKKKDFCASGLPTQKNNRYKLNQT